MVIEHKNFFLLYMKNKKCQCMFREVIIKNRAKNLVMDEFHPLILV